MASVTVQGVRKAFGALEIIKGVDVSIEDGEFVVLVGPSGCGKSTLLRMIAGLETVTDGQITIGGRVVNDLEPRERDIAMVFQSYALYPHMDVRANLSFSLELRKLSGPDIAARVSRAVGILGLGELLNRKPRELSGGQRQRVAMGRAIVREPQLFLFDEPLSNLDAKLRVQMRAEIRSLHDRLGATSIYVTHDQVEAMTMADRIVVLDSGEIAQVGSPLELYDRPGSRFVAEFIGSPSINIVPALVTRRGEIIAARLSDGAELVAPAAFSVVEGSSVDLGFRAEDLKLDPAGSITGKLEMIEQLGAESLMFVSIAGSRICSRQFARRHLEIGANYSFSVTPEKLHAFDVNSGRRLN